MRRILYEDIAYDIKGKILTGVYELGSYIPAEHELETEYKVSKITIRKAIEILVQEGYVRKMSGKGTEVISNRIFNKLSKAESFTSVLEEKGHEVTRKIISVEKVTNAKNIPDGFIDKRICVKVVRLFELDGNPYIYFEHWVPYSDNYNAILDESVSLYTWMQDNGHSIVDIKDAFSIGENKKAADLMDKDNAIFMKRVRNATNHLNQCIEYSIAYYNTQIHPYEIVYTV